MSERPDCESIIRWIGLCVSLFGVLPAHQCLGELTAAQVADLRGAVALVEMPPDRNAVMSGKHVVLTGRSFLPAFCVDPSGLFLGSDEIAQVAEDGKVMLVLDPTGPKQQTLDATVVTCDSSTHMAMLKVDPLTPLKSLDFDIGQPLDPKLRLLAIGFSHEFNWVLQDGEYPSIHVLETSPRGTEKTPHGQERVNLYGWFTPGHAGGPIVNPETGRVLAVVHPGVAGKGYFGVPANGLRTFLETPQILLTAPVMTPDTICQEQEFAVRIISTRRPPPNYAVEAVLTSGGPPRSVLATAVGGDRYRFKAVPMPTSAGAATVRLTVRFAGGVVTCDSRDHSIKLNGRDTPLSQIHRMRLGDKPSVVTASGQELNILPQLGPIPVDLNGRPTPLDLSKAHTVQVERLDPPLQSVRLVINVNADGKTVSSLEKQFTAARSPATQGAASLELREARLEDHRVERELPGLADDVFAGACGRLLFFKIDKLKKLAVFDVSEAKIIKLISWTGDDVVAAANARKLILIDRNARLIQRWDLHSLECDATGPMPEMDSLTAVTAGYASDGLMMLFTRSSVRFLDVRTLKLSEVVLEESASWWQQHPGANGNNPTLHSAADGSAFIARNSTALWILRMVSGRADGLGAPWDHYGSALLSYDGTMALGKRGILPVSDLKARVPGFSGGGVFLPTYHPDYAMAVKFAKPGAPVPSVTIYRINGCKPLVPLPELDEFEGKASPFGQRTPMESLDRRIHVLPWANLLITVPPPNDKLVLREFSLADMVRKSQEDYLVVTSLPSPFARRGLVWRYVPKVHSRRGGVRVSLAAGPAGMEVDATGALTWNVPAGRAIERVPVILQVTDASEQDVFHSLFVSVR